MVDNNDNDGPIQGVLSALRTGTTLLQSICKPSRVSTNAYAQATIEAARSFEHDLHQTETTIRDFYKRNLDDFGQSFINTLNANHAATNRVQALTINLMAQFMGLHLYFDEPTSLELGLLLALKRDSDRYCTTVMGLLHETRQRLLPVDLEPLAAAKIHNDQLIGISPSHIGAIPKPTKRSQIKIPGSSQNRLPFNGRPVKPSLKVLENSGYSESTGQIADNFHVLPTSQLDMRSFSVDSAISGTLSLVGGEVPLSPMLIPREEIQQRLSANDDFLSRREKSRIDFQKQFHAERIGIGSDTPIFGSTVAPIWASGLASTLKLPGYGVNVTDGIEAIRENSTDTHADGLILVNQGSQPTPPKSFQSIDYLMGHDSSFYIYGGFCEGAKIMLRGEKDYFKIVQRPAGSKLSFVCDIAPEDVPVVNTMGQYYSTVAARCIKCAYEVNWTAFKRDTSLDRAGIYSTEDHCIRYRTSFLLKCHLKAKNIDDVNYACAFCVDEHKTIEDHDATAFFSVAQLMRHLSKHPKPVRHIDGIKVCYGNQNSIDYDLNFVRIEAKSSPEGSISTKIASLPTARAILTHRPKSGKFLPKDPDGNPALQFAIGARIIGVRFPNHFNGQWCSGYHDGEHAMFPMQTIQLNVPVKDHVVMNPKSTLIATARWDHKPKDTTPGWLTFSRKEKITHIGFPFEDHWCYSGQNSKGKFGLFPATFVTGLEMEKNTRLGTGGSRLSFLKHGRNR